MGDTAVHRGRVGHCSLILEFQERENDQLDNPEYGAIIPARKEAAYAEVWGIDHLLWR